MEIYAAVALDRVQALMNSSLAVPAAIRIELIDLKPADQEDDTFSCRAPGDHRGPIIWLLFQEKERRLLVEKRKRWGAAARASAPGARPTDAGDGGRSSRRGARRPAGCKFAFVGDASRPTTGGSDPGRAGLASRPLCQPGGR